MPVITWNAPETGDDVANVEIYSSTTENGTYALVATVVAKDGDGNWIVQYDDATGANDSWYKVRALNTAGTAGSYSVAKQCEYSMCTYTTVTLVRNEVKDIAASITDNMIRYFILSAETQVDMLMRYSFKTTFDETKHGPIRRLTTKLAAIDALKYDIANTVGTSSGAAMLDSLTNDVTMLKKDLSITRNVMYLKSL